MRTNAASTSSTSVGVTSTTNKESKRPIYSTFTQQELPACKPLLTPGWVILTFLVIGIVFIPIGGVTLHASNNVVEIVEGYEKKCLPNRSKVQQVAYIQDAGQDHGCNVSFNVPKDMKAPIYIYYQLDHFYQNHRRYVKNRDDDQLQSNNFNPTGSVSSSCKPQQYSNGMAIVPCGIIAWSLFNDTFDLALNGASLPVNRKGISWKSDREDKFGKITPQNFPNNNLSHSSAIGGKALNEGTPLNEDEDLLVWMRTSALPTFRKLWGKIEDTNLLENQKITVHIQNNYNTYTFGGGKKIVLSTTSWLGGKNRFIGIAYLVVGILCITLALTFFLLHLRNPRPLGDPSYLSWNKKMPLGVSLQ